MRVRRASRELASGVGSGGGGGPVEQWRLSAVSGHRLGSGFRIVLILFGVRENVV